MLLCHNIGPRVTSNYNTREEILASNEPLSFDGVYKNVLRNMDVLDGKDVTFFVMGKYVGKDNAFDVGQPHEEYCTWDEVIYMCGVLKAKLGWHTWSHENLTMLSDSRVIEEITPPFKMDTFAYPFGNTDKRVADLVSQAGFKEAWSVFQGDGTIFQRKRRYLNW